MNFIKPHRAVIVFAENDEEKELRKFYSKSIYSFLNKKTFSEITKAKTNLNFDVVLCSNDENIFEYDIFIKQRGNSFEQKFNSALVDTFNLGYQEIIIIGNDSPDLNYHTIIQTFSKIHDNQIVVGPSFDGGIYLLGFSVDCYFNEIKARWKSQYVLKDIITFFESKNIFLLTLLKDIDDEKDLIEWLCLRTFFWRFYEILFMHLISVKNKILPSKIFSIVEQIVQRPLLQKAPPYLVS